MTVSYPTGIKTLASTIEVDYTSVDIDMGNIQSDSDTFTSVMTTDINEYLNLINFPVSLIDTYLTTTMTLITDTNNTISSFNSIGINIDTIISDMQTYVNTLTETSDIISVNQMISAYKTIKADTENYVIIMQSFRDNNIKIFRDNFILIKKLKTKELWV